MRKLLFYELVANDPRASAHYGIAQGHSFDQYWLYTDTIPTAVLLQATKNSDGSIQLSIQGLRGVVPDTANFLDFLQRGRASGLYEVSGLVLGYIARGIAQVAIPLLLELYCFKLRI